MLEKIYTTQGRLNRLPYIKYVVVLTIISFILNFIATSVAALLTGNAEGTLAHILSVVVTLPLSVGSIMIAIRRLHDLNRSGWFLLAVIIPILNVILGIYMLCFKGTDGANKYGADPLEY